MTSGGPLFLVAVDGSPQAEHAFKYYLDTLYHPNHQIVLVHVAGLPSNFDEARHQSLSRGDIGALFHEEAEKSKPLFKKFADMASAKGVTHMKELLEKGLKPGHIIVEVAQAEKANTIVMGTRGVGTIRRTILGSVSDYVLHHAHCPVIISRG